MDRVVGGEPQGNGHARDVRGLSFGTADEGVMLTTAAGTVLEVNPKACSLLRRTRREVLEGKADIFDPADGRLQPVLYT